MLVDCATCTAPPRHCATCVVPTFLSLEEQHHDDTGDIPVPLDVEERRAVAAFVHQGMVGLAQAESLRAVTSQRRPVGRAPRAAG